MLERVEEILPTLAARSGDMDQNSYLSPENVQTLGEAGLLGLVVPKEHGGLGGDLRAWAGACFAIGTVCPSTALAYFFHLTSASRGNLSLKAWTPACSTPRKRQGCGPSPKRSSTAWVGTGNGWPTSPASP